MLRTTILSAALAAAFTSPAYAAPQKPKAAASTLQVCVNQATGAITARSRCKAAESPLSLSGLASQGPQGPAGPQGPQGVPGSFRLDGCYAQSAEFASFAGFIIGTVGCTDPLAEFMLNDGLQSSTALSYVNDRRLVLDAGVVPVGVRYWLLHRDSLSFTAKVTVVCCRR